jgi:GDSL-like lipase/acylhydrolase family protein
MLTYSSVKRQKPYIPPVVPQIPVLLSRSLPVTASTGTSSAVNSSDYNTWWSSTGSSATIAYDISGLTTAQKTTCGFYWYDESGVDTTTFYFDVARATGGGGVKNNQPATYTIEGNTGAGGGAPPGSGWTTLVTVTNGYASRKHTLSGASSLAGYNWMRMNIATSSSSVISLKAELWDISLAVRDMLRLGDSRTWFGTCHKYPHGGTTACDSIGNLMQPTCGFYSPSINTGMSGAKAADIDSLVAQWLTDMPGFKWATLNIGINDALAGSWSSGWSTSYQSIVNKLIAAGVTVFCESIGDTTAATPHAALPTYNSAIATIVSGTPGCLTGFDEYTFFVNTPSYISGDGVHATDAGFAALTTAKAAFYASHI